MMDDDDFYIDHYGAKLIFDAMMMAGGFRFECRRERRYSSSPDLSPIRRRSISPESRKGEVEVLPYERFRGKQNNYNEIAQKNAEELIKEEEQAKIKAVKKKAKKERQKKKKQVDSAVNNNSNSDNLPITSDLENLNIASENKEAEGLDINAAFVSKAVKKLKNTAIISEELKTKKGVKDINYITNKALEFENIQNYKEAVQYLSDAINLDPRRNDLILKRSFLYFELAKFEKSIRDAKKVLEYSPNNADGYYRLGEAHFALSNLSEAEVAYTKLLNLKSYCEEANNRLFSIRIKQLQEMGYHPNEAYTALNNSKNKSLDEAIDFLNELGDGKHVEDLYYSDEDDEEDYEDEDYEEESSEIASGPSFSSTANIFKKPIEINNKSPLLTDPKNPIGCCSLFVGNLKKDITYQEVNNVFTKFGAIKSIKLTTEPNCYAFVNYLEASAAGAAMAALQGSKWLLSTTPLIVKFPINVIKNMIPTLKNPELILRQLTVPCTTRPTMVRPTSVASDTASEGEAKPSSIPVVQKPLSGKARPSPQTEECFYWRTMGCTYGNKCFNLHIPQHKGIDLHNRKLCRK